MWSWQEEDSTADDGVFIALDDGSLVNHARHPNTHTHPGCHRLRSYEGMDVTGWKAHHPDPTLPLTARRRWEACVRSNYAARDIAVGEASSVLHA